MNDESKYNNVLLASFAESKDKFISLSDSGIINNT